MEGDLSSDTHLLNAASYGCFSSKAEFFKLLKAVLMSSGGLLRLAPGRLSLGLGPLPDNQSGAALPRSLLLLTWSSIVFGQTTHSLCSGLSC